MECPFVENQQVVCIRDGWPPFPHYTPPKVPQKNGVYTISAVYPSRNSVYLKFKELEQGTGYLWKDFRPAIDLLAKLLESRQRSKKRSKQLENT